MVINHMTLEIQEEIQLLTISEPFIDRGAKILKRELQRRREELMNKLEKETEKKDEAPQ